MKHLTGEQLVDVADGSRSDASFPHLETCRECRAKVAELRATIAQVRPVDVPQPSPLFWEMFSARVRDDVAAAGVPASRSWRDRLIERWRELVATRLTLPISIAAAAAIVVVASVATIGGRSTVAVPVPAVTDSAIPSEAVEGTAMLPPDDPTLDLVADLGAQLDWDDVHDTGIVAHTGLVDRAVNGLSADERAELGRLLKQELAGGGN